MRQLKCPHCGVLLQTSSAGGVTMICGACNQPFLTPETITESQPIFSVQASSKGSSLKRRTRRKQAKAKQQEVIVNYVTAGVLFSLVLVVFVVCSGVFSGSNSGPKPANDGIQDAWLQTKRLVRNRLKSPSTASFGWQNSGDNVIEAIKGRIVVRGWVDSQNSFGATVRTDFTAVYLRTKNGLELNDFRMNGR